MKRILLLALALVVIVCSVATMPVLATDVTYGDVNADGSVNPLDSVYLARNLANWAGYNNINTVAADVNVDSKVNPKDSVILARHLANWSGYEKLPFGSSQGGSEFLPGIW